jgi:hypothetical protein
LIRIAADQDDATWYDPLGLGGAPIDEIVFNPAYPDIEVGTDGASGRGALRFQVDVPQGSTIVSAKLEVRTVRGVWDGTEHITVQTFNQVDLPPFEEQHMHTPLQHGDAGVGPAVEVRWPMDAGLNVWLLSPELKTVVQPIVSKPNWAQDKFVSFFLAPDAPGSWYVDFSDYGAALGFESRLHISWLERGPIGVWSFEEASGSVALDSSGSNTHGALQGPVRTDGGRSGRDLQFDGVDDFVNLGQAIALTSSFTACAWIFATGTPVDDGAIISKRGSGTGGWQLDTTIDVGARAIGFKPDDWFRYGATPLNLNRWYHVCGVYDATALETHVYLDGVNDDGALVGTVGSSIRDTAEDLTIGKRAGASGYEFIGRIDEVMIWNRPLTAAQVNQVYRSFP